MLRDDTLADVPQTEGGPGHRFIHGRGISGLTGAGTLAIPERKAAWGANPVQSRFSLRRHSDRPN